jgi:hypothetical protein
MKLMPHSLRLGATYEELIKNNMMISGVKEGEPILAKEVASMELTIGHKTLATTLLQRCKGAIN